MHIIRHPTPNTQHPTPNTQHPTPNTQHPTPNTQHPTPNTQHINFLDGLRGIAVLAVIIFHFGYLPYGYLGVDIFFVVSGFLITGLIYEECKEKQFSIKIFYLRRIRRIIPLVTFCCIVSLIIGLFTMLPDDLENLAEQIVATNMFSNNILQAITTKDYWNVVNEFKPLMHTWSLGIEEQYYILYPFLFIIFSKNKIKWILPILICSTILSLILFFLPFDNNIKFYFLPFRFFELSIGGIIAIIFKKNSIDYYNRKHIPLKTSLLLFLIISLIILLGTNYKLIPDNIRLCLVVFISSCIIIFADRKNKIFSVILENKTIVFIGKISFSLYMWHQILLAYSRYFLFENLTIIILSEMFLIIIILSIISYYFIEELFRNKNKVDNKLLFITLIPAIAFSLVISLILYSNAGVVKDVPELDITKGTVVRGLHAQYNDRIYSYDKDFISKDKLKVLIVGNSFARDFANILLESKFNDEIEISYIFNYNDERIWKRMEMADITFFSAVELNDIDVKKVNMQKVWCIGTKNFGTNNGIFYNYKGGDYYEQRTKMKKGIFELNTKLKDEWGDKYIDLIGYVIDDNKKVPVFTPDQRFISQDCFHLVKAGAQYYAGILEHDQDFVLNKMFKQL
jgi:peptidoglycan/LPS O-acetylase OafA/YrhL